MQDESIQIVSPDLRFSIIWRFCAMTGDAEWKEKRKRELEDAITKVVAGFNGKARIESGDPRVPVIYLQLLTNLVPIVSGAEAFEALKKEILALEVGGVFSGDITDVVATGLFVEIAKVISAETGCFIASAFYQGNQYHVQVPGHRQP